MAAIAGLAALTYRIRREAIPQLGLSPEETTATLPGDDVITDAAGGETRRDYRGPAGIGLALAGSANRWRLA